MRISIDAGDPGFHHHADKAKVWHNGTQITNAVTADEEQRMVIVNRLDESGRLKLDRHGNTIRDTYYGDVRIELSAHWDDDGDAMDWAHYF